MGSVTMGVVPVNTDTQGAASVTDISGRSPGADPLGAVGTVTQATTQALASTARAVSPVAGTVLNAAASAAGTANLPADVINLGYWYLTLPTGQQGSPDMIQNPSLERFTNDFFKLNPTRDGVVFSARGDGVTTKNSHYPRSELREMAGGGQKASWSNTTGSHTLEVCQAITKVPSAKPEVVSAQIHDDKDDVLQIRLEGQKLMVQYNNGGSSAMLDPNYQLGTPFDVRITAANSKIDVLYDNRVRAELPVSGSGWYWKVGAYVQSNASHGDAGSVGEVTVYSLNCVHSG
jgi:poly(beta-D-mannuronate) lyase